MSKVEATIDEVLNRYTDDLDGLKRLQDSTPSPFGFWYCLEWGDGYIKIGSTTKPYNRYKSLSSTAKYGDIKLGEFYVSEAHANYRENELDMHEELRDVRVKGTELFKTTLQDIANIAYYLSYDWEIESDNGLVLHGLMNWLAKYHDLPIPYPELGDWTPVVFMGERNTDKEEPQ